MTEVATFLPGDPDLLVRASLSCPHCLHDVAWVLDLEGEDATASCTCRSCGAERLLVLTAEQALRLEIGGDLGDQGMPPHGLWP
jgi:hypothetical protein